MRSLNLKVAGIVAAIVLALGALASSVGAQPIVHVLKAKAVAPIRGTLVWAAYGSMVSLMDARSQQSVSEIGYNAEILDLSHSGQHMVVTLPGLVLVEDIGVDGEHAANPKTVCKVEGPFVQATFAGWLVVGMDAEDNVIIRDCGQVPVQPCPFKGGCPEDTIFLPLVARNWDRRCGTGGPDDPCAPTPPAGPSEDPTPGHGPVLPTPTPQSCGYPPC